jgi:ankyrin repeat protein
MSFEYGDYDLTTPLHMAVRNKKDAAVQYLLNEVQNVNPIDR